MGAKIFREKLRNMSMEDLFEVYDMIVELQTRKIAIMFKNELFNRYGYEVWTDLHTFINEKMKYCRK